MKKLIILTVLLLFCQLASAEHLDLDKLLVDIKQSQANRGKIDSNQESQFINNVEQQKSLLNAAQAELKKQEALSAELKTKLTTNAEQLSSLESNLAEKTGSLADLFGIARQVAGDLKAELTNSIISAQFPNRTEVLGKIANDKAQPNMEQLEKLWFTLQQEMTESGKVVYYDSEILSAAGEPRKAKVIRVGVFNAMAEGKYLRYLPETGKLSDLPRQPEDEFLNMIDDLSEAKSGQVEVAIDPTRGSILGILIQTPDLIERIKQGGIIGYITLSLGFLGFLYGLFRLIQLSIIGNKMFKQMNSLDISEDNPLGRILAITEKDKTVEETSNLELLLDEAIMREIPMLEQGLSIIKLIAAIGPLLGLLGTVTGMIITFQTISLFGSGDPKLMAEGISRALVTTVEGLCVAIPLLFLHSVVASRSRVLIQILDEQTAGLISKRAGL